MRLGFWIVLVIRDRSLFSGGGGGLLILVGGPLKIWGGPLFFNLDLGEGYEFLSLYIFSKSQQIFKKPFGTLILQTRRSLTVVADGTIVYITALAHFYVENPLNMKDPNSHNWLICSTKHCLRLTYSFSLYFILIQRLVNHIFYICTIDKKREHSG